MAAARIFPTAPVGSLLKQPAAKRRPVSKKLGRAPRDKSPAHLDFLRALPCCACLIEPCGEAAHLRFAAARAQKPIAGTGAKPDDRWCVPLCPACHRDGDGAQHRIGEPAFWARLAIDPLRLASTLWGCTGDVERGRAIVHEFRQRRT